MKIEAFKRKSKQKMSFEIGSDNKNYFRGLDSWVELAVAWSVAFCMFLFAAWTLAHHAATFLGISWRTLSNSAVLMSIPATLISAWGARKFAIDYTREVYNIPFPTGLQGVAPLAITTATTALLLVTPIYGFRLLIALIGLCLIWQVTRQIKWQNHLEIKSDRVSTSFGVWREFSLLMLLALIAVFVTLASHRPDLDDCSFIQIADQTLRFPERAPLTFDASLGTISEPFRFAPYRLASYETLVALLAEWTGFDLLSLYYLLVPGVTAVLTIGVAYLFSRWFLPSPLSIVATGIFLLIMLAWGESHVAYGNRLFVRLFQGKGLLIALATPMIIIAGLLFIRSPSAIKLLFFFITQVATIGFSSTGLLCLFVATGILSIISIRRDIKVSLLLLAMLATTLVYPALLGIWIKYTAGTSIPLNEIGTHLPINSSLGLGLREALTLSGLALGVGAFGKIAPRREYFLLVFMILALAFNPWLAELMSSISSRNMSWRLAWAVPVPLLLAVAFAAAIWPFFSKDRRRISSFGALSGMLLLMAFLAAGRWTLAKSNQVVWGWPSPKVSSQFLIARDISVELKRFAHKGTVLVNREVGAWLPLLAPDVRLVMPGHTYPLMLQTVISTTEYNERMQLFNAINGKGLDEAKMVELMRRFNVAVLLVQQKSDAERYIIQTLLPNPEVSLKGTYSIAGHRLFLVDVGST